MLLLVDSKTEVSPSVDNLRPNRKAINNSFIGLTFSIICTCQSPLQHRERGPLIRTKMEGHEKVGFQIINTWASGVVV